VIKLKEIIKYLKTAGFVKLTSLDDALKKTFSRLKLNPKEEIETSTAFNRILANNVISEIDVPPFKRSAMDGYAIKAEDSFGASPKNPKTIKLVGKIEIGDYSEQELNKGEAIRISTGAMIPIGADAVVKIEDTEIENNIITMNNSVAPGKNVSKKGEDIPKGTQILNQGTQLRSEHVALLYSLGIEKIMVRAPPKVSVFATGNELVEVGNTLGLNKIYNSNLPMISNLVKLYGGTVVRESTLKDNKELIKGSFLKAEKDSQVIVSTGGTSVGTKDLLPEIIHENGTILIHGIAMRPGAPLLIGFISDTLIFCLPGTPVAAYIGFLTIVGPTIRKMMGCSKIDPRVEIYARINRDVPLSSMGHVNHLRVKIKRLETEFMAIPVKLKGSGIISSLTQADGIVEIPPHQEGLKKGERVLVKLFPKYV